MLSDGTDLQAPSNYANRADRHSQLEAFKCQLERFRLQATLEVPALAARHTAAHYRVRARNDPILHSLQPKPYSGQQQYLRLPEILRLIPLLRPDAAQTSSRLALRHSTERLLCRHSQAVVSCTTSPAKEQTIDNVSNNRVSHLQRRRMIEGSETCGNPSRGVWDHWDLKHGRLFYSYRSCTRDTGKLLDTTCYLRALYRV